MMIAADVYGEGHYTEYPSQKTTVALQLPFKNGRMPEHRVVYQGPCEARLEAVEIWDDALTGQVPLGPGVV